MEKQRTGARNKSTILAIIAVATIFIAVFSGAIYAFQSITHDTIHEVSTSYLEELGGRLSDRINAKAVSSCNEMLLAAEPLDEAYGIGFFNEPLDAASYLMRQCRNSDMRYMALISRDGMCYGSDKQAIKLADTDSVTEWLAQGKTFITSEDVRTLDLPLDDTLFYYFVTIVPFDAEGETIVAMIGGLDASAASNVLGNDVGYSDASVVTTEGTLMFFPEAYASEAQGGNLFNLLGEYATFTSGGSIAAIKEAMADKESYLTEVMLMDAEQYLYFTPLKNTDMYICIAVPAHFSESGMTKLSGALAGTAILVIVGVIIAAFLFSYFYSRSLRHSRELLAEEKERAEAASAEARQASMAKSDFLSRMSHEIRTPLSGVIGMTEVALRNIGDTEKTVDSLNKIDLSSKHLLALINDILDMSKIEQGKIDIVQQPFNLRSLLDTIDAVTKEQAAFRKLHFRTIVDPNVHDCYIGDQLRLSQILYNLLSNSLKFTPEKGFIILHVSTIGENERAGETEANSGSARETADLGAGEWLRFVVSDTGRGIDEEFIEIIFDPFEQGNAAVSQKHGGTGLGLAITKRFAEMMGGGIDVSSALGKGAVFTLTLPFEPCPPDSAGTSADENAIATAPISSGESLDRTDLEGYDFSGNRILVVEDNDLNREIALELIGTTNATVESAENGAEAVEKFGASESGYYDLILMDIQMPLMDGYEATKYIRAMDRPDAGSVPIIAMTANAFQEDVERCIAAGMNDHTSKPLDTRVMFAKMNRLFRL